MGLPSRPAQLAILLRAFDLTVLLLASLVALSATTGVELAALLSIPITTLQSLEIASLITCWWFGMSALKPYPLRPWFGPMPRFEGGAKALPLGIGVGLYGAFLLGPELLSSEFIALLAAAALCGLGLRRCLLRLIWGRDGSDASQPRRALVVGTGPRARSIAHRIDRDPALGIQVIGFVDDEWSGMEEFRAAGKVLASDLKNLDQFLLDHAVDEIVLALPLTELRKHRSHLIALCRSYGLTMRFPMSQLVDLPVRGERPVRDDLLLSVYHGGREGWRPALKRTLDPVLALVLLGITAPLFVLIAALIKLDSRGPVFFTQERVGLNRRRFRMYKFRTMVDGAESRLTELEQLNETCGPTFKLRHDPRITRVGRWLRRTSLDELPQLVNILAGEMSLVGPRPLPLRDFEGFEEERYQRRFSVRPGLTGLWQVSGRSLLPFETWMELDLRYVDEWSLVLDLRILIQTIPAVLSGQGAE